MTIVHGQIESLKRVKSVLSKNGIQRFKSINDIDSFNRHFETEKQNIISRINQDYLNELNDLQKLQKIYEDDYEAQLSAELQKFKNLVQRIEARCSIIEQKNPVDLVIQALFWIQLKCLYFLRSFLEKNTSRIVKWKTRKSKNIAGMITDKIAALELNRERIISDRKTIALRELIHTKKVIDDLYPTIAGAIGENLVEKELRKLSDKNILFNDFLLHSESGSIQIDHLLLNNAGIFLIETKNWSKESVENYELRSPVSQIKRSSRTLFSILNNETANRKLGIKIHHWGEIQIPIRSIIVMINNKPAETFKYVKVKTLDELNGYLNYFDPIFSDDEVQCIADYLNKINRNFTFPKNQQAAQYLSEVY